MSTAADKLIIVFPLGGAGTEQRGGGLEEAATSVSQVSRATQVLTGSRRRPAN